MSSPTETDVPSKTPMLINVAIGMTTLALAVWGGVVLAQNAAELKPFLTGIVATALLLFALFGVRAVRRGYRGIRPPVKKDLPGVTRARSHDA
jgi:hypothetical protein